MSGDGTYRRVPPILRKILWTGVLGGLTYVVTDLMNQPHIWTLTITVFIGGVSLVVQFLNDFDRRLERIGGRADDVERRQAEHAEEVRRVVAEGFGKINEVTRLFSLLEGSALRGGTVLQLIRNATEIDKGPALVHAFAEAEMTRTSEFLKELGRGDATYDGEDRNWLLSLVHNTRDTLDATSTMTLDAGGVDFGGGFWMNEAGERYLVEQGKAIQRGVRIRRIFIVKREELINDPVLVRIYRRQRQLGIDVKILNRRESRQIARIGYSTSSCSTTSSAMR